jgi:lipopolysaccharide/colanic/teichoic acid biosynthesis glycosyltransferase
MLKRCFDLIIVVFSLVILTPIFLVTALAIFFEDKGPIFFLQERVGRKGKKFKIFKFRSMINKSSKDEAKITIGRDKRITKVGYFLRKSKIDELPQLFNVLLGDMSLVGPRPEVPYYVALYDPEQIKVLDLIPGITDLASIRYRHLSDLLAQHNNPEEFYIKEVIPDKIEINLEYAKHANVVTDLVVLFKTLVQLFK